MLHRCVDGCTVRLLTVLGASMMAGSFFLDRITKNQRARATARRGFDITPARRHVGEDKE